MPLSATPLAVYEFDDSGSDATGAGPTLAGGTYSTTSPKIGTHSLRGTAEKTSPLGNLEAIAAGKHSIAFWFKLPATDICSAYVQNGAVATGLSVSGDIDTDIWVLNRSETIGGPTSVLPSTTWRYAVMTWDLVTTKIYIDNALKYSVALTPLSANLAAAKVGVTQNGGTTRYIDQAAFFDVDLSADDITYLYNSGNGLAYADWEVTAAETPTTLRNHFYL